MFFPVGDVNLKRGVRPVLTHLIMLLNFVVFVRMVMLSGHMQAAVLDRYGAVPADLMVGVRPETLLTSLFLHAGWMHLIGNMLFLWVFGDNVEATLGYGRYLLFYFGGGIAATLAHAIMNPYSTVPCVGASGAIAACLGAYLIMFPRSRVRVFFVLILSSFSVPAVLFLGFWILQQLMAGVGAMGMTADTAGVAYWAHIGGFVFGVVTGLFFRGKARELQDY